MKHFLLLCATVATMSGIGQNKDIRIPNYSKMPYWIEMIKNPNVNYYDAVTAYEEFWKGRKNPLDNNAANKDVTCSQRQSGQDKKERILYLKYVAECEKFENWKTSVKPRVQPDGRIVSKTH